MTTIEMYSVCSCGAYTFYTHGMSGQSFSCSKKSRNRFFPGLDLRKITRLNRDLTCDCDHCANHWGLDLCGCGSGEPFGKCDAGLPECAHPMQEI